ncbi:MAG: CapA family protein [Polyangiaceae bacterium]
MRVRDASAPAPDAVRLFTLCALLAGCQQADAESSPAPSHSAALGASAAAIAPLKPQGNAPATTVSPPGSVSARSPLVLLFGGDVNLGRGTGQRILRDPGYQPLRFIKPYFDSADFRFVNLESQLSEQDGVTSTKHRLIFTGPPGGAAVLKAASVDLVSVANNHMWDFGKSALLQTFDNLDRSGVRYVGASPKPGKDSYDAVSVEVRGVKIGFFAVTHIWNQGPINEHEGRHYVAWADFGALETRIAAAKRDNDLVILSYHGGAEYVDEPMMWTRHFVRAVMRAGVDVFIGHHPHVPQGVGWAGSRPVFYSLGNLVFPMHSDHPWTGTSFLARLSFDKRAGGKPRLTKAEACPYFILGHVPKPFEDKASPARHAQFKQHLDLTSRAVGGTEIGEPGADGCYPLNPPGKSGPGAPLTVGARRAIKFKQGTP